MEKRRLHRKSDTPISDEAPHLRPIVEVALNTGMRLGEILNLQWNQVDFENPEIRVEKTKSKKKRYIPINSHLKGLLLTLWQNRISDEFVFPNHNTGKPITDIKRSFNTTCRRARIADLRFHDLRHTFASRVVANGTPINVLMEILGHSSIKMTQRYMHSNLEQKRQAVESLNTKPENLLNIYGTDKGKNEHKPVIPLFSMN